MNALFGLFSWRSLLRSTLLFLCAALPLAFYLRTYDSATVKITLLQLGALLALAIWLAGTLQEGRAELPLEVLGVLAPALLLGLWNAARFAFAGHRTASLHGFLQQEAFLTCLVLALFSFTRGDARRVSLVALAACSIVASYGLAQRLGLDPFIWRGAFGEKVFSTFGNPYFLAVYLSLCAPLCAAAALDEGLPPGLRAAAGTLTLLLALVSAWTKSLIEPIALCAGLFAFTLLAWKRLDPRGRRAALGLAGLCAALCLALSRPSPRVSERLSPERSFWIQTWKGTAQMIARRPFLGYGPGSFWVDYPAFRRPEVILIEHGHNTETDHPENEALEQWAEGGLPSLLLWLWLCFAVLRTGWKAAREPFSSREGLGDSAGGLYACGLLASVAAGLLPALCGISLRFPAPGALWYIFAGACAAGARRRADGPVFALPLPLGESRAALAGLALFSAGLAAGWPAAWFVSDLRHNYAIYYSKQKEWTKALEQYDRQTPGAPSYVMGQYFKGNVLNDMPERDAEAVEQYRKVRSLAPDYVQVHFQEGIALRKLGRVPEAIERLERQTELDPVWDRAWEVLSELYREAGREDDAARAAERGRRAGELWSSRQPAPRG